MDVTVNVKLGTKESTISIVDLPDPMDDHRALAVGLSLAQAQELWSKLQDAIAVISGLVK